MKVGDLVLVDSWAPMEHMKHIQFLGIYLRNDPTSPPSFPMCEILTPNGIKLFGVERITFL